MSKNYIEPTGERDLRDLAALAKGRLALARCNGGRWTDRSNICAHCGIDMEDNPGLCGQPLAEDGMTPFDASVAMRLMRESEEQF